MQDCLVHAGDHGALLRGAAARRSRAQRMRSSCMCLAALADLLCKASAAGEMLRPAALKHAHASYAACLDVHRVFWSLTASLRRPAIRRARPHSPWISFASGSSSCRICASKATMMSAISHVGLRHFSRVAYCRATTKCQRNCQIFCAKHLSLRTTVTTSTR